MDNQNNQNNNQNNQNNNQNGPQKRQSLFMLLIAVLITIMGMSFFMNLMSGADSEITYSEFLKMVKNNEVKSVVITDTEIEITPKEAKKMKTVSRSLQQDRPRQSHITPEIWRMTICTSF